MKMDKKTGTPTSLLTTSLMRKEKLLKHFFRVAIFKVILPHVEAFITRQLAAFCPMLFSDIQGWSKRWTPGSVNMR